MLEELQVSNLRNIQNAKLFPSPSLNVLLGENGSGKSSLLESVHILSTGRSFRTVDLKNLLQFEKQHFLVRGKVKSQLREWEGNLGVNVGFMFSDKKERLAKIEGEKIKNSSDLARLLPMKFLSPLEGNLIEGAPSLRRRFLDWLMFHVEPDYLPQQKQFKSVLSNRNATLRKKDRGQEPYWRSQLIESSVRLSEMAEHNFEQFKIYVEDEVSDSLNGFDFHFELYRGWRKDTELSDLFSKAIDNEFKFGSSRYGFQRADLKITVDGKPSSLVLSRGQMKILALALHIAQIKFLKLERKSNCVVLIDDIIAELDDQNICTMIDKIIETGNQCFVTSANVKLAELLKKNFSKSYKLFHVEHGTIKEEE
ncbi:DNA replication/repair protein RecF [Alteromonas sp. a30]|uniref:DNA replication/repair protein RecF n=1 Tax=Alteromonas sp. a30 TaxID=2730917 RepID=UPI00227FAD69|nr:DNA replication and repair protein RecF [Alteromonas sp. a30]MCY7295427.1 DNA replication/repair protein RecF [Alteromonas sp. a30]